MSQIGQRVAESFIPRTAKKLNKIKIFRGHCIQPMLDVDLIIDV